jgi:hypothetical protein
LHEDAIAATLGVVDTPDVVELLSEADFTKYLERGGVIVIHDDANASGRKRVAHLQQAHKACTHVDVQAFREKVLDHGQAHGRYWWTRNSKVAEHELQAVLCFESARLLGRT